MVKAADTPLRNVKAEFKQWILLLNARKKKTEADRTTEVFCTAVPNGVLESERQSCKYKDSL